MNVPVIAWVGNGSTGGIVRASDPVVTAFDPGLLSGQGVFETILVAAKGPIALTRHLRRLGSSADALGLAVPPVLRIRQAIADVCAADSGAGNRRLRITVTAGSGDGCTLIVTLTSAPHYGQSATVITAPWPLNEYSPLAQVKTTSYVEHVLGREFAEAHGADEAIFGNTAGTLCEGAMSNVFCVFGDRISTPSLDSGCLPGVIRELVVEWYPVDERAISLEEARGADEVFLTSSLRGIQPIRAWDGRAWEKAGPVTAALSANLAAQIAREPDL